MADKIQFRRDTAANWTAYNPILLEGEIGYVLNTQHYKLGDGIHAWNDLELHGFNGNIESEVLNDENSVPSGAAVFNSESKKISVNSELNSKYITDKAIENFALFTTQYNYGDTTIFGNTVKASNLIDGVYVNHYGTGALNIYKINVQTKSYELIETFENLASGWVRLDFVSRIELKDEEYIGVDNNFYYNNNVTINNPGQFALVKSNSNLTFSSSLEIGIVTFRKNDEEFQKDNFLKLQTDRFISILGETELTQNKNYINYWTTRFNQTNVCFADASSYINKVTGCFVKVNKQLFSSILLYKVNISSGSRELIKSVLITDDYEDGQMIDVKFDSIVELTQDERIAISGAFWFKDNCGVLNGKQVSISSGSMVDINKITYGFLPYYNKTDVQIYDYNKTKSLISAISEDIETDNAINAIPRCTQQYYQANQLWGNKYQTANCMVDGIFWKVHYDTAYTSGVISIYKVNISDSTKILLKQVQFDDNWGEGEIVQILLDKREVLKAGVEYIMILAPIYFKDRLSDGNSITCSLTGNVSANTAVDIGFFTYCAKPFIDTSIIQGLQLSNRFKNKKVAWYGTSIPAGEPHTGNRDVYSYANIAVKRLGGQILNYCVSGSCLISKENTESTTYNNIRFSDTTAPINYQNSMLDLIGTLNEPDWFVFDFGANDAAFYKSQFDALDFDNLDFTSTDKKTFLGAFNLVIKSLLQAKPKAKIILVTHFSDDSVNGTHEDYYLNLNKLIRRIGEYWQIPVNDISHKCGFMYRNSINTLNAYMPIDGLHPGNSLEVVHLLADIHYKFLLNL